MNRVQIDVIREMAAGLTVFADILGQLIVDVEDEIGPDPNRLRLVAYAEIAHRE